MIDRPPLFRQKRLKEFRGRGRLYSWLRAHSERIAPGLESVTFGRAGTLGRTIRRMVPDDAAADRFLAGAMARRRGSMKRCGAAYRVLEARGFDGGI